MAHGVNRFLSFLAAVFFSKKISDFLKRGCSAPLSAARLVRLGDTSKGKLKLVYREF